MLVFQGLIDHLNKGGSVWDYEHKIRQIFEGRIAHMEGEFWAYTPSKKWIKKMDLLYMPEGCLELCLEGCTVRYRGDFGAQNERASCRLEPQKQEHVSAVRYDLEKKMLVLKQPEEVGYSLKQRPSSEITTPDGKVELITTWVFSGKKIDSLYIME